MDFWARLKDQIKEKNTTQEWVAGKIGVPFGTFRNWLVRKSYPDIKQGIEIAGLLETSAEYLVSGKGPEILSDEEQKLVCDYRKLDKADQKNIILAIEAWLRSKHRSGGHRPMGKNR
jgi:transcriptional regulator with XRE-family HTH domain